MGLSESKTPFLGQDSLVIVSRLDDTSTGAACRLALYGCLVDTDSVAQLRVYKVRVSLVYLGSAGCVASVCILHAGV